jgi:hypothetical protein
MNNKQRVLRTFIMICLGFTALSAKSFADDRMAGSVSKRNFGASKPAPQTSAPYTKTAILDTNTDVLESRGLLHGTDSLGTYLWENSNKGEIFDLVEDLPPLHSYPTLHNLNIRALKTAADVTLMSGSNATNENEGRDFLTLRLEKLFAMGHFADTAALYTQSPFEPYHERFARVGVSAIFISGQQSLACLEAKSVQERFGALKFWKQMNRLCDFIMFDKFTAPPMIEDENEEPKPAFIDAYLKDKNKVFTPDSLETLAKAPPATLSFLISNARISYKKITTEPSALSPMIRSLLLTDKNLPQDMREAIEDINRKYEPETSEEQSRIKNESFTTGPTKKRLFSYIAYLVTNNFSDVEALSQEEFLRLLDESDPIDRAIVGIIAEKLDKQSKLHNYGGRDIYEKHTDLTFDDNYVMQSIGLMNSLQEARNDNRLGEVILLSSIILHDSTSDNIKPDVIGEVIDSFVTVGLTNEAKQLTKEFLLSFDIKGE